MVSGFLSMVNDIWLKILGVAGVLLAFIGYKAKVKSDGIKQGRQEIKSENNEALLDAVLEDKPIETNDHFDDDIASDLGLMRKDRDEDSV